MPRQYEKQAHYSSGIADVLLEMGTKMKSKLICMLTVVVSAVLAMAMMPSRNAYAYTYTLGSYYYIQSSLDSNKVLDVSGGSKNDGANIQLYKRNGTNAQLFRVERNGDGYYTFINKGSNKAIDVYGAGSSEGTNVQQWSQNSTRAQQWVVYTASGYPDGYVRIKNRCGLYLDVSGADTQNGTNIHIWSRNDTKAQVFVLVPYDPAQTYYKTCTLGSFSTYDQWTQRMQQAERSVMGISSGYYDMNGDYRSNARMIVGKEVLAYKTITVSYDRYGKKVTQKIKLPSKVKFTMHKHDYQKLSWFDFSYLTLTETCSCGAHYSYTWEVPYPE